MKSYVEFAEKLAANPCSTVIRTDMQHLHNVLNDLRIASDQSPLAEIRSVSVVDSDDVREGIEQLIHAAVMGVAMGDGTPFSDIVGTFHIAATDVSVRRHTARPKFVSIDITLVHDKERGNNEFFAAMKERLSCDQKHRNYC